jgi:hypothetical protein
MARSFLGGIVCGVGWEVGFNYIRLTPGKVGLDLLSFATPFGADGFELHFFYLALDL